MYWPTCASLFKRHGICFCIGIFQPCDVLMTSRSLANMRIWKNIILILKRWYIHSAQKEFKFSEQIIHYIECCGANRRIRFSLKHVISDSFVSRTQIIAWTSTGVNWGPAYLLLLRIIRLSVNCGVFTFWYQLDRYCKWNHSQVILTVGIRFR